MKPQVEINMKMHTTTNSVHNTTQYYKFNFNNVQYNTVLQIQFTLVQQE
jgi:hypothetical protein